MIIISNLLSTKLNYHIINEKEKKQQQQRNRFQLISIETVKHAQT